MKKEQIEEYKRRIFYEILSWYEDEGDYQPTEEETNKKVTDILNDIISKQKEEMIKIIEEEFECGVNPEGEFMPNFVEENILRRLK